MKRKILILVFVFLIALASGLAYRKLQQGQNKKPVTSKSLLACAPAKVDGLQIMRTYQNGNTEDLAFVRNLPEGINQSSEAIAQLLAEWTMISPIKTEASNRLLITIPNTICEMSDEFPYTEKESLSELGLDPPTIETNLVAGEERFTLRLGKKHDAKWVIAAVPEDKEKKKWRIFWAPAKLDFILRLPQKEFQNKLVSKMNIDSVQALRLSVKGKESFTLERNGDEWTTKESGKTNTLQGPEEAEKFANRVGSLQGIGWEKTEFSTEECNKLDASYTIQLEGIGGRTEFIRFTAPQTIESLKEKRLLACNSARRALFQVHPDMEKYLKYRAKDLLKK
jgi:hypothetical protein